MSLPVAFQKKYDEFAVELKSTFPELDLELACAAALTHPESMTRYHKEVYSKHKKQTSENVSPGIVLPGVFIEASMWASLSKNTQDIIYKYLSILDLCSMFENASASDIYNNPELKEWANNITKDWRADLDKMDFQSISEKFKDMFGSGGAIPALPEKFL